MGEKKAVSETPVEEPKSCGLRLPQRGRDFTNDSLICSGFHTLQDKLYHTYLDESTTINVGGNPYVIYMVVSVLLNR